MTCENTKNNACEQSAELAVKKVFRLLGVDVEDPNSVDAFMDAPVKKVFAVLGVDFSKPESVEAFRADLRFGKKLRAAADKGFLAMVAVVFVALISMMFDGFSDKIRSGASLTQSVRNNGQ